MSTQKHQYRTKNGAKSPTIEIVSSFFSFFFNPVSQYELLSRYIGKPSGLNLTTAAVQPSVRPTRHTKLIHSPQQKKSHMTTSWSIYRQHHYTANKALAHVCFTHSHGHAAQGPRESRFGRRPEASVSNA